MSRQMSQRNLTLTEELEKLEQSITLTLQEIDSNFSKAHRIVTTSILPIVEQYAKHSNDVWEGSKFWKQFFEASANVSLSGYEENANEDEEEVTHTDTTSTNLDTPTDHGDYGQNGGAAQQQQQKNGDDDDDDEEFTVDSPTQVTGLQTTPKLPSTTKKKTAANGKGAAAFRSPSPRKYTGKNALAIDPSSQEGEEPSTPRPPTEGGATNPQSSPFEPESAYQPSAQQSRTATNNNDPLMHRVLDKNYRIQATPHTQRRQRQQQQQQQQAPSAAKPTPVAKTQTFPWDDSPQSSPALAAPQLRSDLFSPAATASRPTYASGPRTPGISVLTPARGEKASGTTTTNGPNQTYAAVAAPTTSTGRQLFSPQDKTTTTQRARTAHSIFSSPDSNNPDNDEEDEMSPPKTLQFHVPNSRLMQTPAREASKKIVEDLLLTAGADATDDIEGIDDPSLVDEPSPSLVRNRWGVDVEDSF